MRFAVGSLFIKKSVLVKKMATFENLDEAFLTKQVLEKRISQWFIQNCTMCEYSCRYLFQVNTVTKEVVVSYDNGCYCGHFGIYPSDRTMKDVLRHIKRQSVHRIKEEHAKFWGFSLE